MEKKVMPYKKIVIIVVLAITIILLIFYGTIAILYIQALLGKDLIIKSNIDKNNIFLKNNESTTIKIKSYALTNLFCNTFCTSRFIDLSNDLIISENSFSLKIPRTDEYILASNNTGFGQNLYHYEIECISKKSFLCQTKQERKKEVILITLNYEPNQDELKLRDDLKKSIENNINILNNIRSNNNEFDRLMNNLNKTVDVDIFSKKIIEEKNNINSANDILEKILIYWENDEYESIEKNLVILNYSVQGLYEKFIGLNDSIYYNISVYNIFVDNITNISSKLSEMMSLNYSNITLDKFKDIVNSYNELTIISKNKYSIDTLVFEIVSLSKNFNILIDQMNQDFFNNVSLNYRLNESINQNPYKKIELILINKSIFSLKEPREKCCLNKECKVCCNESCYSNKDKYPVIFLHGHSFNERASAENSLDSFENMQETLESDGYIDTGSLYLLDYNESNKGVLGKTNNPVSFKVSYYFDIIKNKESNVLVETKTDNLDTYTLRLKDIIDQVKFLTNKEKVIIIAHSMGGLISRRYIQVFGENDIDKIILIGTPNNGIDGNILSLCSVLGTKLECSDMDKTSLFMNKLNNAKKPSIPIINIMGLGCSSSKKSNNEDGDGIVTNSSAYLKGAANFYIKGNCKESEFKFLHNEMLDSKLYPEVYEIVKDSLKG